MKFPGLPETSTAQTILQSGELGIRKRQLKEERKRNRQDFALGVARAVSSGLIDAGTLANQINKARVDAGIDRERNQILQQAEQRLGVTEARQAREGKETLDIQRKKLDILRNKPPSAPRLNELQLREMDDAIMRLENADIPAAEKADRISRWSSGMPSPDDIQVDVRLRGRQKIGEALAASPEGMGSGFLRLPPELQRQAAAKEASLEAIRARLANADTDEMKRRAAAAVMQSAMAGGDQQAQEEGALLLQQAGGIPPPLNRQGMLETYGGRLRALHDLFSSPLGDMGQMNRQRMEQAGGVESSLDAARELLGLPTSSSVQTQPPTPAPPLPENPLANMMERYRRSQLAPGRGPR